MVCESHMYKGMYHTLKLSTDPTPLLEANNAEFKILLSKKPSKNRWLTTGDHPIFLDNNNAKTIIDKIKPNGLDVSRGLKDKNNDISLIKLIFVAKNAFEAYLINSLLVSVAYPFPQ